MKKKLRIGVQLALGIGAILIGFALVGLFVLANTRNVEEQFEYVVNHDAQVISNAYLLFKLVVDMETGQRGFLITQNENFLEPYYQATEDFEVVMNQLKQFVSDNPVQLQQLTRIEQILEEWKSSAAVPEIELTRELSQLRFEAEKLQAMTELSLVLEQGTGKALLDALRVEFTQFIERAQSLSARGYANTLAAAATTRILTITLFLSSLVLGVIITAVIRRRILSQVGGEPEDIVLLSEQIASGDLDVNIPQSSGILSSIKVMMDSLKLNRDHMANLVDERTAELNHEVQEHKRLQEEKERLEFKLVQAERLEALGVLAGGVAHDLNNIIGPMLAYPELIKKDLADGHQVDKELDVITASAQRAADVVAGLLSLTRSSSYRMQALDLNELLNNYLDSPESIVNKNLQPEISVDVQLCENKLPIRGSEDLLLNVLINFLNNAVESMRDGGSIKLGTTTVDVANKDLGNGVLTSGRYCLLTIEDQGEGIAAEELSKIYDPFYTTKQKSDKSGTGLGLTVVFNVLKNHDAVVDVESKPGQGTRFSIYFPEFIEEKELTTEGKPSYRGHGSVLILDDREEQREMALRIVTRLGYQAESVSCARDAINYLKDNRVDLLWLDMILEEKMDGLDVYKEAIKINPNQKAIIVSGYSKTERIEQAQALGVNAFIQKPFELSEISACLGDLLNSVEA